MGKASESWPMMLASTWESHQLKLANDVGVRILSPGVGEGVLKCWPIGLGLGILSPGMVEGKSLETVGIL